MLYLYLLAALLLGILAGVFTGLIPGIHTNLIAVILITLVTSFTFFSTLDPIILAIFLVAMSITHTFVDYIPSVFLGAPDEDNFLSILPGHDMLLKGKAHNAIVYTLYGSIAAIAVILLLFPIYIYLLNPIYPYIQNIIPHILIIASIALIYFEKNSRTWAIIIFFMAGFLGIATLNLPTKQPLLPLFTGLFGISSLITSIMKKQQIPKQKISKLKTLKIKKTSFAKTIFASMLASPLVSFLPGLGTGQAAVIGSEVTGDLNQKEFLVLLGSINTMVMGLSFITLYTVGKARTGTSLAVQQLLALSFNQLFYILATITIAGVISFFITLRLSKLFAKHIHKFNYKKLSYTIIILLTILTFYFSGFIGLLILITATFLGLATILLNIRRTHLMGALILPVILLYLL